MRFAWQAQWFRALWCRCLKLLTQNPWKGCKFHVTDVLLCSDHFAWQLQDLVCLGSTFSWQAQCFWSMQLKIVKTYWNSEVKCLLNMSILKEVSQKCFVFELQSFIFEGSLAEMLRFGAWKLHFWRKSRRKASFWSFKDSILKEVSQKSFVFDLQSFVFEGSLAEMLRFWASKLQFWRKSRRKVSFLIFKASFLKEVSQKCFVFELQSFNFEGSLAEMLRFWAGSQINWQPPHWNLKWTHNQNHLKHIHWQSNRLNFKSLVNPNHLNLTSIESDVNWLSNQLNSAHPLPIGSLSLETSATALCGRYVIIIAYSNIVYSDTV